MYNDLMDDPETPYFITQDSWMAEGAYRTPNPHFPTDLPITYITILRDVICPPAFQDRLIQVVPAERIEVVKIEAGHMAMLSQPREVAKIVDEAAKRYMGADM